IEATSGITVIRRRLMKTAPTMEAADRMAFDAAVAGSADCARPRRNPATRPMRTRTASGRRHGFVSRRRSKDKSSESTAKVESQESRVKSRESRVESRESGWRLETRRLLAYSRAFAFQGAKQ